MPASGSLPVWRRSDQEGAIALQVTEAGLAAIGLANAPQPSVSGGESLKGFSRRAPAARPSKAKKQPRKQHRRTEEKGQGRGSSKQALIIAMLRRVSGASIPAIVEKTGWQPHSVRGFLTGTVKTKLGLKLVSEKVGEKRVYRIVD